MKILFINNNGGGFADHIEVPAGTTVRALFDERISGKPADFLIRVNRQPTAADQILQEGDRVSVTPTKIEGALGDLSVHAVVRR
jgi:sulfur carrier protein ThiS